eukprot:1791987-Amphidinium_carterae.1
MLIDGASLFVCATKYSSHALRTPQREHHCDMCGWLIRRTQISPWGWCKRAPRKNWPQEALRKTFDEMQADSPADHALQPNQEREEKVRLAASRLSKFQITMLLESAPDKDWDAGRLENGSMCFHMSILEISVAILALGRHAC